VVIFPQRLQGVGRPDAVVQPAGQRQRLLVVGQGRRVFAQLVLGGAEVEQGDELRLRVVDGLGQRRFLGEAAPGRRVIALQLGVVALVLQHKGPQEAVIQCGGDGRRSLKVRRRAVVIALLGQHLTRRA